MIVRSGSLGGARPKQLRRVEFVDGVPVFGAWQDVVWVDEEGGDSDE